MALYALPSEILHMVCTWLRVGDIRSLRQVSRVFGYVGAQYLFPNRTVTLVITEQSMARVGTLSQHPVLSKSIRRLDLCCYMRKASGRTIPQDLDQATRDKVFAYIHDAQHSLAKSGTFLASVKGILSRLSNLQSLRITAEGYRCREMFPDSMARLLEALSRSERDRNMAYGSSSRADELYQIVAPKLLKTVLEALGDSSLWKRGREIWLDCHHWPYPVLGRDLSTWRDGIENITRLAVHFHHLQDNGRFGNSQLAMSAFVRILTIASNLTDLSISSRRHPSSQILGSDFSLPPQLKRLQLAGILTQRDFMFRLFRKDNTRLERLGLGGVKLVHHGNSVSWISLFQGLKNELPTSLQDLDICWTIQRERKVEPIYEEWPAQHKEVLPPERALRYLICHNKTHDGRSDAITRHPYDWESISWTSIISSINVWKACYR